MRPISYILLLNIFWSCGVSGLAETDPLCTTSCTADCEAECPLAAECADGQQDCGSIPNPNPFCPADRICVAGNCDCPTLDNTGQECPDFCNIECSEAEKFCEGGRDEKNCKLPDECVERGIGTEGTDLCPGFCPVTCETEQILCPVPNDASGCAQAPVCEAKGKDSEGADCPGVCSVSCEEEKIVCSRPVLENGCTEADTCVLRGRNVDDELCPGTCPVECTENEILCPECILPDGCKTVDQCRTMAKDLSGKFCPAASDSHQCPKTCEDDEVLCPTFEDQEGCKGEALCVKKTVGVDEEYCPTYSVCHTPCKVNELACAGGMDENGCKNPDTCLPMARDVDGELCTMHCPGECEENEIQCEGETSEEGCKGPDICVEVGSKLRAPNPEEVGTPCPGYCPIHECPEGEIKCPDEIEPCFLCKTEEECRIAAKDHDGVFCDVESASHNCPTYCDEPAGEVLCPSYEDERGCKPKSLCMMRVKDSNDNYCPSHSVCPMVCGQHEMLCPNGIDINGCKDADSCLPRGADLDGNLCPVQCPPVCTENQDMCYGEITENGCNGPSVCVDIVLGNGGAHCRTVCPITCEANKELVPGGADDNGCPVAGTCKVPKTFSDWTNEGDCTANSADLACGPGTQTQKRTCTNGEVDLCAEPEESRIVSCAVAGSELPTCPVGACPSGFEIKCLSGACKCYGIITDNLSWSDARTKCMSYSVEGGNYDLASITTTAINDYISSKITEDSWHGLSDVNVEGEWTFVDGTAYSYDTVATWGWNTGEPNDYDQGEDCAEISVSGKKWNDNKCDREIQSVCEGPAYSCSCTDFVNENGYGACGKEQAEFGGLTTCYVNEPSSCSDLVASTTDPNLHQSARACVTATNFFAMDGCSTNGDEDSTPQNFAGADSLAEVQCCSKDGTTCVRQNNDSNECWSGDDDDVKVTWFEAYDICASHGYRLCSSQEELDLCCGSGCQYDFQPLWTSLIAGETETPIETPM